MDNSAEIKETGFFKHFKVIVIGLVFVVVILGAVFAGVAAMEQDQGYSAQGSLKYEETDLNSKVPGNIEQVLVEEGDNVKKGDVLLIISGESIEAKKLQAQGALAAAEATYQKALNGARNQEVIQAKTAAELYEKTYLRVKTLFEDGAVSENDYDQVFAQYIAARETYDMALQGARPEDVLAAEALVLQAEGAVAEVDSYLEDCIITASMDGVVTAVNANEGELISTGMPLVTILSEEDPWIEVNVLESELRYINEGKTVKVTFAAYRDRQMEGTIREVSRQPDFAVKRATGNNGDFDILSYGVKVRLNGSEGLTLYPGMTVMVDFGDGNDI